VERLVGNAREMEDEVVGVVHGHPHGVDGFRVARTRGTMRRTQGFERRGLNVGDLGSQ
jgi:hypothetical protein